MKLIKILIGIFGMFLIMSCVTTFNLSPITDDKENMDMLFMDGKEVAISYGKQTNVGLFGLKTERNEIILHIAYRNNSDNRINIIPENITVVGIDGYEIQKDLKVYSAEAYLKKLKTDQAIMLAIQGLNAINQSVNAGKSTSTVYGNIGTDAVSGTITTHDPAKKAVVSSIKQQELQQTAQTYALQTATTEQGLLKRNTLFPNQIAEGNVVVKYKSAKKYIVKIPAGDDVHIFEFLPNK